MGEPKVPEPGRDDRRPLWVTATPEAGPAPGPVEAARPPTPGPLAIGIGQAHRPPCPGMAPPVDGGADRGPFEFDWLAGDDPGGRPTGDRVSRHLGVERPPVMNPWPTPASRSGPPSWRWSVRRDVLRVGLSTRKRRTFIIRRERPAKKPAGTNTQTQPYAFERHAYNSKSQFPEPPTLGSAGASPSRPPTPNSLADPHLPAPDAPPRHQAAAPRRCRPAQHDPRRCST